VISVIHLIPYHAIGGVERAASTMIDVKDDKLSFSVFTIFPQTVNSQPRILWNPVFYLDALRKLYYARPNVLVVSLWRACAVGLAIKLIRPRTRLVLFLHFPEHVHALDRILTGLTARFATRVWADSRQTLRLRLPRLSPSKCRVISFVTERITPASSQGFLQPSFIFWGRIHPQKGLQRAVALFSKICSQLPDSLFVVIGPDGGDLTAVRRQVVEMNLSDNIHFRGGMEFSAICREAKSAAFYLQTSELEGMAMSVVEAMQLGLVPVVTPVGEIGHYARDGTNSLLVVDDAQVVDRLLEILRDETRYQSLRASAIATWQSTPLYKEDVMRACKEIFCG